MFARIAGRYDLLNRTLSLGIDQRWRRRAVRRAGVAAGARVVDVCCGTGDLALAFARAGAQVVGVDFTPQMLSRARRKGGDRRGLLFVQGDALALPIADGACDGASIAFGLRNVADRRAGLVELARVVRPGGWLLVLEFSTPPGRLLGGAYRAYFTRLLPRIGRIVSGDGDAYSYLPRTVLAWPGPEELARELRALGLEQVDHELLSGGIVCLHRARVPPGGLA